MLATSDIVSAFTGWGDDCDLDCDYHYVRITALERYITLAFAIFNSGTTQHVFIAKATFNQSDDPLCYSIGEGIEVAKARLTNSLRAFHTAGLPNLHDCIVPSQYIAVQSITDQLTLIGGYESLCAQGLIPLLPLLMSMFSRRQLRYLRNHTAVVESCFPHSKYSDSRSLTEYTLPYESYLNRPARL